MTAEQILAVSAAVLTLTQLVKWRGLPDRHGPTAVLVFALIGVLFWGWSHDALTRAASWEFFAGWLSCALNASGVYGFTRASATALIKALPPPGGGAGSEPTVKE